MEQSTVPVLDTRLILNLLKDQFFNCELQHVDRKIPRLPGPLPLTLLHEAFDQTDLSGETVIAYQLARIMDLQGHPLEASVALGKLKSQTAPIEAIERRLSQLQEEIEWSQARAQDINQQYLLGQIEEPPSPRQSTGRAYYRRPAKSHTTPTTPQTPTNTNGRPATGLYDRLRDPNLLWVAFQRVEKNQGGPGADGITIEQFWGKVAQEFKALKQELAKQTFTPGNPAIYLIPKPKGGQRRLCVPCVRDRIVLTAAGMLLAEVYEPLFSPASFAYRTGRSVALALREVQQYFTTGYRYAVDADIVGCFDNIVHKILLERLAENIDDGPFLDFIGRSLPPFASPENPQCGIAQGSPLSPILCNVYLDALDQAAFKEEIPIIRYADDFVLLAKDEAKAQHAFTWVDQFLRDMLQLEINRQKTGIVRCDDGLEFLGQIVRP